MTIGKEGRLLPEICRDKDRSKRMITERKTDKETSNGGTITDKDRSKE